MYQPPVESAEDGGGGDEAWWARDDGIMMWDGLGRECGGGDVEEMELPRLLRVGPIEGGRERDRERLR